MATAFTRISLWLWGASKDGEPPNSGGSPVHLSSSFDFGLGFREPETVKLSTSNTSKMRGSSSRRSGRRKWHSREERRIDRECDVVVVPPDGGCLSGSESDGSDWSIGWLEPHAPEFQSAGEEESSFAVLVPCYGRGRADENDKNRTFGALGLADSSDGKKYMEELLSTLQSH